MICRARLGVNSERELRWCGKGEVAATAEDERADVEEGFGGVGGDKSGVTSDGEADTG